MNLRNVLRAYSLLRVLNDDEAALLETLRAANDNERQLIAEAMSDKPQKKAGKKSVGGGGRSGSKSQRASGMAAQLNKLLQQQRKVTTDNSDDDNAQCAKMIGGEKGLEPCEQRADHNIHHLKTYPGYHPFQSAAPPAANPSSANDEASTGTQNSGTQSGDASNAAHGGD